MIRQTLLRQFNEQDVALQSFYSREEGLALFMKMAEQRGTSGYIHRKKELVERLKLAGIRCSMSDEDEYLKERVGKLPKAESMERRLMDILYGVYKGAMMPAQQIEQLVRRLGRPEYQSGSVRLAIVKQFLVNTTWHTKAIAEDIRSRYGNSDYDFKNPETLAQLADEALFGVLEKPLTKDEKRRYTLLRVADDLATGRFRSNGGTRTALYMFAFAFEMSVFIDPDNDKYDPDRDIEKNLFFDYYGNCLLRFISEDYEKHSSDYEAEPSGEGINYKNFAEAIYLYYLGRTDLEPAKRLRRANNLIDECVRYAEDHECIHADVDLGFSMTDRYTYIYRDLYLVRIRSMPEEELVEFICDNYIVGTRSSSAARIAMDSEMNTAAFHFRKNLANALDGPFAGSVLTEISVEESKRQMQALCSYNDEKFSKLIDKLCDMLFEVYEADARNVSRSHLIALAFENFMNDQGLVGISMSELYREFCGKLNPILEDSRYQPICDTNIFDMFVVLLLYRNLNIL